jgi:glycosyltransferase involved in cell wall biosynthesis
VIDSQQPRRFAKTISVIVPAHNEAAVIVRTLRAITDGAEANELEVIVVCNGCTDDTAAVARSFGAPVRVIETEVASKTHALNLGDKEARHFPRIYVDADVVLRIDAIRVLANRLESNDVLVVAPTANIDLTNCSWIVRAFYNVRALLPSAQEGIGGSGVYALSETGRKRFGEFPKVTADDGYVRIQFCPEERETLASVHSTVFPPRAWKELVATKTRSHFGSFELERDFPDLWKNRGESNKKSILGLFKDPRRWLSLCAYCLVTVTARRRARKRLHNSSIIWERDDTSRVAARQSAPFGEVNS